MHGRRACGAALAHRALLTRLPQSAAGSAVAHTRAAHTCFNQKPHTLQRDA
jgi:hypothetical protein